MCNVPVARLRLTADMIIYAAPILETVMTTPIFQNTKKLRKNRTIEALQRGGPFLILISSDTSLRNRNIATPNASMDGSFPKTWKFEIGAWWLYKLQSATATRSERDISHVLMECGWDAAEY